MMLQQNPNVAVWQTADEYLGAAEILLDYNRLRPAAILAALSLELCLKCFLARRIAPWTATTSRGHSLVSLFNEISLDDRKALLKTSTTLDSSIDFEKNIERFDRHFENGRYLHEPDALNPIGSAIVYFARHVHSAVHEMAKQRNVRPNISVTPDALKRAGYSNVIGTLKSRGHLANSPVRSFFWR